MSTDGCLLLNSPGAGSVASAEAQNMIPMHVCARSIMLIDAGGAREGVSLQEFRVLLILPHGD